MTLLTLITQIHISNLYYPYNSNLITLIGREPDANCCDAFIFGNDAFIFGAFIFDVFIFGALIFGSSTSTITCNDPKMPN